MAGGHVDRGVLSSNYQQMGDIYSDGKTEAAFEVVAQQVDSNWDDYKVIKDKLASIISGDSGAHNVASAPIPNLTGANVYAQIADLMSKILSIQNGAVPSGTITPDKLSFDPDSTIKDAGGTATAITINAPNYQYSDNAMLTFIAATNNAGAATTINVNSIGARPLYKPGTTTPPTLIAGKAYTVWFDATANCFFIKASAEGTAVAGHVLAGQTFSNDVDVGIEGAVPVHSSRPASPDVGYPNTAGITGIWVSVPEGYYPPGTFMSASDPNFSPENIVGNIFGLQGTAVTKAQGTATATGTTFTVTGLAFRPNHIILSAGKQSTHVKLYVGADAALEFYGDPNNIAQGYNTFQTTKTTAASPGNVTLDNSGVTMNNDGFTSDGITVGDSIRWWAYGL